MPSDRDDKEFAAQEITSPVREEQNPTQEIAFPVDEKQNVVQEIAFPVWEKQNAVQEIAFPVEEKQNAAHEITFPPWEKQNPAQEIAFPVSLQKRTNPQRCTVNGFWRMPQITILGTRGNVESAAPRYSRHSGVLVDNSNIRMR